MYAMCGVSEQRSGLWASGREARRGVPCAKEGSEGGLRGYQCDWGSWEDRRCGHGHMMGRRSAGPRALNGKGLADYI